MQIPERLANIIDKLIHKEPDARYQSIMGIKNDILNFQTDKSDGIEQDVASHNTYREKLAIPTSLYGRENEIKILPLTTINFIFLLQVICCG